MDNERDARTIVESAERDFARRRKRQEAPMPEELQEEVKPKEPYEDVQDNRLREALVATIGMLGNVAINVPIQKVIATLADIAYIQYHELRNLKAKAEVKA